MKITPQEEEDQGGAGDAMLLMIPRVMWEALVIQSRSEGLSVGMTLEKMFRRYMEASGSDEAIRYLHDVSGRS